MSAQLTGQTLAGRYRIEALLGGGGMGAVYDALDLTLNRRVAVKVLLDDVDQRTDPRHAERLRTEAFAAAGLAHPHIIQVTDFVTPPDGPAFLVMERLEGRTLGSEMRELTTFPLARALSITMQIAGALAAAHAAGIVHRDIKPENLFLVRSLTGADFVKVLDFGIAKVATGTPTTTGAILGTVSYMSPEQAMGSRDVGPPTDVFAIGLVLYKMLTGTLPHPGTAPADVLASLFRGELAPISMRMPGLPPSVTQLVDRCLAIDPRARFADGRALLFALEQLLAGFGMMPRPSSPSMPEAALTPRGPSAHDMGTATAWPTAGTTRGMTVPTAPPATSSRGLVFVVAAVVPIAIVALVGLGGALVYLRGGLNGPSDRAGGGTAVATTAPSVTAPPAASTTGTAAASTPNPAPVVAGPGKPPASASPGPSSAPSATVAAKRTPYLGAWNANPYRSSLDRAPDLEAFRRVEPAIAACLATANLSPCEGRVDPNMTVGFDLTLDMKSGNVKAVRNVASGLGCRGQTDGLHKSVPGADAFRACVSAAARNIKLGPPRQGVAEDVGFSAPILWR